MFSIRNGRRCGYGCRHRDTTHIHTKNIMTNISLLSFFLYSSKGMCILAFLKVSLIRVSGKKVCYSQSFKKNGFRVLWRNLVNRIKFIVLRFRRTNFETAFIETNLSWSLMEASSIGIVSLMMHSYFTLSAHNTIILKMP